MLLHHLLETALRPELPLKSDASMVFAQRSPVACPAHSNYLRSLRDRLASTVINDGAFVRIVCQAVSKIPLSGRAEVWTSRAMIRLARRFRANDYEAFISLCHHLMRDVAETQSKRRPKDSEDPTYVRLCDRLAKWLETLCERIICLDDDSCTPPTEPTEIQATVGLLTFALTAGLHQTRSEALKPVADAVLCLALICTSSRHSTLLSPRNRATLKTMMRAHSGTNVDTFNSISSIALSNISKEDGNDHVLMSGQVNASFASLRKWGYCLRSHKLFLLEAWFWSNILAHVEDLCPEIGSHYDSMQHRRPFADELERLRKEIVGKIEEAERRHFDDGPAGDASEQTPSKAASVIKGSQFRWEELFGCWVLKTPLPVKPRRQPKRTLAADTDGEEDGDLDRHDAKRACYPETPTKPRAPSVSSSISLSSYASSRSSRMTMSISPRKSNLSSRLTTPDEQENATARPVSKMTAARRRSSFASILADARSNRVVLHAADDDDDDLGAVSHKGSHSRVAPEDQGRSRPKPRVAGLCPPDVCDVNQLSSDDLDLFAYRLSEW